MTIDRLIGVRLGNFEITERIASGASAVVYKARQTTMGDRVVALKVLKEFEDDPALRDEWLRSFRQESQIISRLQHPHILPVFDAGEAQGRLYLAMQLIEAGTLYERLEAYDEAGDDVPMELILRVIRQVGSGLDYAHQMGVLHRDVKPMNVLVDDRFHCFITDFGIGKLMDQGSHTRGIKGTPWYMSPEQCLGEVPDSRSDLYALGVMLYEMVVGIKPFTSENTTAILLMQVKEQPRIPETTRRDISPALRGVILRSIAKQREDRFPSAQELVAALEESVGLRIHEDDSVQAVDELPNTRISLPVEPAPTRRWRGSRVGILATVTAVALLAVLGASFFNRGGESPSEPSNESAHQAARLPEPEDVPRVDSKPTLEVVDPEPLPAPLPEWHLQARDLTVVLLWTSSGNVHLDGRLDEFKDATYAALNFDFPTLRSELAGPEEATAEALSRLPVVDFQRFMADRGADAVVHLRLELLLGDLQPNGRKAAQLSVKPTLFTRDDGPRSNMRSARLGSDRPLVNFVDDLVKRLDAKPVIESCATALGAWLSEIRDEGRMTRLLVGGRQDEVVPEDDLRRALTAAGVAEGAITAERAERTPTEVTARDDQGGLTRLRERQLWRLFRFRYRGEPGDFSRALDSAFSVPPGGRDALLMVERLGNLVLVDRRD
ncbi:MAG: serine/threonine protein kinase [Planctomycetes bacterium]|nr:serine/threonine protein kinase [Planctomycetota bacterium]